MANYTDLTDNISDDFPFVIRGQKYRMRYPKTDEIEEIQKITQQMDEAQSASDSEKSEKLNKELEDKLYGFITPEGHATPIREALKNENIKVMQRFNTMIRTEFSV